MSIEYLVENGSIMTVQECYAIVFVIALVLFNVPLFMFLAWLAFDSPEGVKRTFSETIIDILKLIFIPRLVRVILDIETDKAVGLVPILAYFFVCGALFCGEIYLMNEWGILAVLK